MEKEVYVKISHKLLSIKLIQAFLVYLIIIGQSINNKIRKMQLKYIVIFLLCAITIKAQEHDIIKKNGLFKTISTPRSSNDNMIPKPSAHSEHIKIITPALASDVSFNLRIKEYVNGKEVSDYLSNIFTGNVSKGNKIIFELVPDKSDLFHFKLFTYFPGSTWARYKKPKTNSTFKYCQFQRKDEINLETEVPLLFIYEDNISDSNVEVFINSLLENNKLSESVAQEKNIYSIIKRYCIVYYTIKAHINE